MELIHCQLCERPTLHIHKNFSGVFVHEGDKCMVCGNVHIDGNHEYAGHREKRQVRIDFNQSALKGV